MNQTKNQMACAAPVAARRQATCRALPLKNHRRALKFSSGQVAGLPRRLPRKSQATLSHSAVLILVVLHLHDVALIRTMINTTTPRRRPALQ